MFLKWQSKNIDFINCGAERVFITHYPLFHVNTIAVALAVTDSRDIVMDSIGFRHGKGGGILAIDVYGNLTISNTVFTQLQSTCFSLLYRRSNKSPPLSTPPFITISNSQFISNYFTRYIDFRACEIGVVLHSSQFNVSLHVIDVTASNNTLTKNVSGISIISSSKLAKLHVLIERYSRKNNTAVSSSLSSDFYYLDLNLHENSITIELVDSNFINNSNQDDNNKKDQFDIFFDRPPCVLYFEIISYTNDLTVSIRNITISNINGHYSSAVFFNAPGQPKGAYLEIRDSTFANNTIFSSNYYEKGTVVLSGASISAVVSNCLFLNNRGTGLLIEDSHIRFNGTNVFRGNRAYNGGGLALHWHSQMILMTNTTLIFEENLADNYGGGLYVEDYTRVDRAKTCFISFYEATALLHFFNNFAETGGNDVYGGDLYTCDMSNRPGWLAMTDLVQSPNDYVLDVTSDPLHVCDCSVESTKNCINIAQTIKSIETYPGRTFNLSVMTVGQLLNTTFLSGVPSAVYASLLPQSSTEVSPGRIPQTMLVQKSERQCSQLTYQLNSSSDNEVMVLAVRQDVNKTWEYFAALWQDHTNWQDHVWNVMKHELIIPAYVRIHLLPCPTGFELSPESACVCSSALKDYVLSCSINTMLIQRKPSYWLALKDSEEQNNSSTLYLAHKHCPFDYCRQGTFQFSLGNPDSQCSPNRSGILCGACKAGYSLILGGTECRQCSNIYLLLLIPFALAGILLIAFLSLTDMTVAAGTINGLLFYANIVSENKATFFPPQAAGSFLSVFVAWLNLDLGIHSCFYKGLDAYTYTWLQLSFPIYIWMLAFGIIISSRHLAFMNKLCGSNIVQVLATLFLLSYTKLQNSIATSLSFTVVEVSDGESMLVWLKDGNVPYLQGKHIALFIVNFLFLIIFLAYTLSIAFGPWLQRKTQYKIFCWVLKLKPLFDAYYGPLRDQHRYWTGVLLLSRLVLSLISAVNILGDDSVNLLAIIMVSMLLLVQLGHVYKSVLLTILESFFFVNLGFLASFTLFNKLYSVRSQHTAIYISTGSTFAIFSIILLYHSLRRLKMCIVTMKNPNFLLELDGNADIEETSDDDMLGAIDNDRASN